MTSANENETDPKNDKKEMSEVERLAEYTMMLMDQFEKLLNNFKIHQIIMNAFFNHYFTGNDERRKEFETFRENLRAACANDNVIKRLSKEDLLQLEVTLNLMEQNIASHSGDNEEINFYIN